MAFKKNQYVVLRVPLLIVKVSKARYHDTTEDQLEVQPVGRRYNLIFSADEVRMATPTELRAAGIPVPTVEPSSDMSAIVDGTMGPKAKGST